MIIILINFVHKPFQILFENIFLDMKKSSYLQDKSWAESKFRFFNIKKKTFLSYLFNRF